MNYELSGKVVKVGKEETFGSNGFRKRILVLMTDDQYPQTIPIEFTQDKCDLLNAVNLNDVVTVKFNLKGREWINPEGEAKYFGSVQGWALTNTGNGGNEPVTKQAPAAAAATTEEDDDLPF